MSRLFFVLFTASSSAVAHVFFDLADLDLILALLLVAFATDGRFPLLAPVWFLLVKQLFLPQLSEPRVHYGSAETAHKAFVAVSFLSFFVYHNSFTPF